MGPYTTLLIIEASRPSNPKPNLRRQILNTGPKPSEGYWSVRVVAKKLKHRPDGMFRNCNNKSILPSLTLVDGSLVAHTPTSTVTIIGVYLELKEC